MSLIEPKEGGKTASKEPTTKKKRFERVEPGLYRYLPTGGFYRILKVEGKTKYQSLETTDKPTARRLLAQAREQRQAIDSNLAGLEFGKLTDQYLATVAGKAAKTVATRKGIIKSLLACIAPKTRVRAIKVSEVEAWAGKLNLAPNSFNEYTRVARAIFHLAVADRAILVSPANGLKRKKVPAPDRKTPTKKQFNAIVADVRSQRFNAHADESADFIQFMGLAGLGQAELRNLRLCDVRENREMVDGSERVTHRLAVRRQKTGASFEIPIYVQVQALLDKLVAAASQPAPKTQEDRIQFPERRLFRIDDANKALEGACKRLGLPNFEQRSLRRYFITNAVEKGLDFKSIAKLQGHKDGGVLVAKTYSHLRDDHLDIMAAKLA